LTLLVHHGIYIVKNLRFDELAAFGEHRFTFVRTPLRLVGATGSPVRPITLIPQTKAVEEVAQG
jgi:kynurenine formamidase